jgi:hypothetical protein
VSPERCSNGQPVRARAPTNAAIAVVFDEVAHLLEAQGANRPRVRSYRRLAAVIRRVQRPVAETLIKEGVAGLAAMTKTSPGLAAAIAEIVATGHLGLLDGLRGALHPERLLVREAGIGNRLARRVEETLGIVTLAELQVAAADGRLASVPGFAARRVQTVDRELATRLGARAPGRSTRASVFRVPLEELLDVDRQYRAGAVEGRLPRIAPPEDRTGGFPWPPILHTARGERQYTALFAGTALAHVLEKTNDWVVVYAEDPRGRRQAMVVTETVGPHAGERVVRGREHECRKRLGTKRAERQPSGAEVALRRRRDVSRPGTGRLAHAPSRRRSARARAVPLGGARPAGPWTGCASPRSPGHPRPPAR